MGSAWISAELVKTTGLAFISGVRELPTPAAPEWTHPSLGAPRSKSAAMPYPM